MKRRDFVRWTATAMLASSCRTDPTQVNAPVSSRSNDIPALFVSHGAPTLALDVEAGADFRSMAVAMPDPRAIVVVSAHWLDAPATIGTQQPRPLLYDFSGFDRELYGLRYDAPAAADVAQQLVRSIPTLHQDEDRPWDHGVWVPLLHMYPAADVPVVQVSLPYSWSPRELFDFGRKLAPLRSDGVLVLASGGAVHNLGAISWGGDNGSGGAATPAWATDFEGWLRQQLDAGAVDDLVDFRARAPALQMAHPTDEHLLPLLVALGASADRGEEVSYPIEGFELGSLSRLAVRFG